MHGVLLLHCVHLSFLTGFCGSEKGGFSWFWLWSRVPYGKPDLDLELVNAPLGPEGGPVRRIFFLD